MSRAGRAAAMGLALLALGVRSAAGGDRLLPMVDYVQEVWDAHDGGLPHPTVTALRQTRDGYLWVGTYSGLVRFDGQVFHRPTVDAHLVYRDHVRSLVEAPDGVLWVGTRRAGLARLQDGVVRTFATEQGLPSNDVTAVALGGQTVWGVATGLSGGLFAVDAAGTVRRFGAEHGLTIAPISALFAEGDGTVWVGGARGALVRYDGQRFHPVTGWATERDTSAAVNAIARGPDGALWLGTGFGALVLEGERGPRPTVRRRIPVFEGVASLVPDAQGLWAGTLASGVMRIAADGERRYGTSEGLHNEWAQAVQPGAQGTLWVGTRTGLVLLRPRIVETYTQRDGLPSLRAVCVLATRDGDVWVGTSSGLARRHAGKWSVLGVKDGLPHASVRALAESPDGALWIGTADGLARFKDGGLTVIRSPAPGYTMRALAADATGRVWVGASEGIDRVENGVLTRVVPRSALCGKSAVSWLRPAADGSVWIGGENGLMRLRHGRIECFTDAEGGIRSDVRHITDEVDGLTWIGSVGGLARMRAGKIESLEGTHAPFNTPNYAVVDDGLGSIWCSTTKGLFQVREEDLARHGGRAQVRAFGVADGLATSVMMGSGQPSGSRGPDGRLYFTSADGIAILDPARLPRAGAAELPLYIEGLLADGRAVPLGGTPRLAPGTREVELRFAAIDFMAPERVRYRYRLEPLEEGWREGAGRRVAQYTNLRPGVYRFQVMAADRPDAWNEPGASLTFELRPRFRQTLAFRGLMVAALVGAVFGAHRLRLARARARAAELQRRVNEAVASLQVLHGLLPICARCRRVRQDTGYWQQLEAYIMERSDARFSHSICSDCYERLRAENPGLPDWGQTGGEPAERPLMPEDDKGPSGGRSS